MQTRAPAAFLKTPENRSALAALQDLLEGLNRGDCENSPNPLFLHGPSGAGKTRLIEMLAEEANAFDVCRLSANDFADREDLDDAVSADLLIVEDLHHLPVRFVAPLIRLIDERLRGERLMVFTALHGPGRLMHRGAPLPRRLTTRLASGLVVRVDPMSSKSRRLLLGQLATESRLRVDADVLDWLAAHLIGGARQVQGAIGQLRTLERLQKKPLRLADVRAHFAAQIDSAAPSVERIARHVSDHFRVPSKQLMSARRSREIVLPRQVSMYLTRQLTRLSLEAIGKYFGGRDHRTVQHACKKVETAMKTDAALSGAVRQMYAELQ